MAASKGRPVSMAPAILRGLVRSGKSALLAKSIEQYNQALNLAKDDMFDLQELKTIFSALGDAKKLAQIQKNMDAFKERVAQAAKKCPAK
jgi:hypothetical protein